MKSTITYFFITFISIISFFSQEFETDFIKSKSSAYCGEENFKFDFEDKMFVKTDSFSGEEIIGFSKITQTNYDSKGYYFEVRTPKFFLDDVGVDEYKKYNHYSHKILYDKRGGNVLYVYELDMKSQNEKFYFTKEGKVLFCK